MYSQVFGVSETYPVSFVDTYLAMEDLEVESMEFSSTSEPSESMVNVLFYKFFRVIIIILWNYVCVWFIYVCTQNMTPFC